MDSLQTPVESASEAPVYERPDTRRKWYMELLETCRAMAGLPVLVSLIAEAFTPNTKVIGVLALAALVVALILEFFPKVRNMLKPHGARALWTMVPWFSTAALAVITVFVIIPHRSVRESALLANSWLGWQRDLEDASSPCSSAKTDRDKCLSKNLAPVITQRPQPLQRGNGADLASDLMAGQLMLANGAIRTSLQSRMSVGDTFLGTGFSQPVGQGDFTAARAPEYFVPNLSDQAPHVWAWELDPNKVEKGAPIMAQKLLAVLHRSVPMNHADFEENWAWLQQHVQTDDPHPVLVRFGLFDPAKIHYSTCLGRLDATRVFMSNLATLECADGEPGRGQHRVCDSQQKRRSRPEAIYLGLCTERREPGGAGDLGKHPVHFHNLDYIRALPAARNNRGQRFRGICSSLARSSASKGLQAK